MMQEKSITRKNRQANKTLLIFGEGLGEEVFLKHLRGLYAQKKNVRITIKAGKGGSADRIVIDASKERADYDERIVVLDNDKASSEMGRARKEAKERGIRLLENTPCLEAVLLAILDKRPSNKDSIWCKHEFEANYLEKKKRGDMDEYKKLFKKELLEEKRFRVAELGKFISVMEGN
ncbi:MAG: hypothetical protein UT41_C0002G0052 [Candidatus Wolfebacteria bacterium GW2011_GWC2_39_22]|uniref:RloB domain-containing protein n=1 Tax=Candidatus Wolfebacteria bacterium GW2011_GWC2_39_22 TaxID=1619013 RepID=A0A0G0N9Z6_9BACT|nr:MAG: hypothetical protein UT41_C0002G0052 [Candidatus Wolfebacteria bacterium GW2011_GWC2_39_22]